MTTNLQIKFFTFVDTVLRVPPLFVMDEVLKLSFGFSPLMTSKLSERYSSFVYNERPLIDDVLSVDHLNIQEDENQWNHYENQTTDKYTESNVHDIEYTFIPLVGKVLCCILAVSIAQIVFLLSWSKLAKFYKFIFSILLIVISYQTNMATFKVLSTLEKVPQPALLRSLFTMNTAALWESGWKIFCLTSNYLVQAGLGLIFATITPNVKSSILRGVIILLFLSPTLSQLLPLPNSLKNSIPFFTALIPLCILKYVFLQNISTFIIHLVNGFNYAKSIIHNYGVHSLLESEWARLNVPNVLRTFWLIRTAHHLTFLLSNYMFLKRDYHSLFTMDPVDMFLIFKEVMISGCDTSIALLGMTSIVSYIGHYIGVVLQAVLLSDDADKSLGTICAILFFVLAEQSGLTVLEGSKRFIRLCRNFTFLFTAMLHFTHNMVNPVLMSLSASRNPVTHRHVRVLSLCFALILFPCLLVYTLWSHFTLSTWLLAVSAFSTQVVVKTLVSLLIYVLFLIDAYRNNFWESLDDYVYYIRAFGNSVEFVFGILLFFTGAWIYLFESGGSIRATMICIHAYFNIWCEAKNGWNVFMKRRTAVKKINSLPEATEEELEKLSDVCAICFQDLNNAKVTKCHHFFHSICLRKWLYVRDSCPLCHETLYRTENIEAKSEEIDIPVAENERNENVDEVTEVGNTQNSDDQSEDKDFEVILKKETLATDEVNFSEENTESAPSQFEGAASTSLPDGVETSTYNPLLNLSDKNTRLRKVGRES
ncbi:Protein TRC8-like protein [Armadillidium vulgare]|nr:Protein TRC8-like protein [Armadillidium vulgare]